MGPAILIDRTHSTCQVCVTLLASVFSLKLGNCLFIFTLISGENFVKYQKIYENSQILEKPFIFSLAVHFFYFYSQKYPILDTNGPF